MKVIVEDADGSRLFSYDVDKVALQLCPGREDKQDVIDALEESLTFLKGGSQK